MPISEWHLKFNMVHIFSQKTFLTDYI